MTIQHTRFLKIFVYQKLMHIDKKDYSHTKQERGGKNGSSIDHSKKDGGMSILITVILCEK